VGGWEGGRAEAWRELCVGTARFKAKISLLGGKYNICRLLNEPLHKLPAASTMMEPSQTSFLVVAAADERCKTV